MAVCHLAGVGERGTQGTAGRDRKARQGGGDSPPTGAQCNLVLATGACCQRQT